MSFFFLDKVHNHLQFALIHTVSVEANLTTPPVNTVALEKLFLELAATAPNVALQTVTIPPRTSVTVVTSSRSVTPVATIPPPICVVTIMRWLDWVEPQLVAAHGTATAL